MPPFFIMNTYTFFDVKSYFAPGPRIDRWLHPFRHYLTANTREGKLEVKLTGRAKKAIAQLDKELYIEMQLMYSCIPKKRVIFHEQTELDFEHIGQQLNICYRAVQPTACDPAEFAKNYPIKKEVKKVNFPKRLFIDYKNKSWNAYFEF